MRAAQKIAKAVMRAFDADGVTVIQFNEPAAGQTVFHLHVHVIPRFDGVALRPHTGTMEKPEVLAANAEKVRKALAAIAIVTWVGKGAQRRAHASRRTPHVA